MSTPALTAAGDPPPTQGDSRPGRTLPSRAWTVAFLVAAAGTMALLLWLGREATFFADGWTFIDARLGWDVDAFLAPHWEHPVVLEAILWKVLFETVGLGTYAPYLLLVGIAHAFVAGAVFTIVRRSAGDAAGFFAALVLLLLGSGGEALLVALSLNLVGAMAAGTWALALFLGSPGRRGRVAIALLLLVSVGFSGAGLFFIAALGATALVVPGRWRDALLTVPALAAYLAWQAAFGVGSLAGDAAGSLDDLPAYLQAGIGHAAGAVMAVGDGIGLVLAVLLVAATVWHLLGRRPVMAGAVSGVVGLVAVYLVTGLARATIVPPEGGSPADASRYVYLAAPFLLIAAGAWLARRPRLSVREPRQVLPVLALVGVALLGNGRQLLTWRDLVTAQADEVRAAIAVLTSYGGSPALPADRVATPPEGSYLRTLPAPDRLRAIVARHGRPGEGTAVRPAVLERVLLGYVGPSFRATRLDALPPGVMPPAIRSATDAATAPGTDGCLRVTPTGAAPAVVVTVAGGSTLVIAAEAATATSAALSADGTFSDPLALDLSPAPDAPVALALPDLDAAWPWQVRLSLSDATPIEVCRLDG